jgi:hypothetical protein
VSVTSHQGQPLQLVVAGLAWTDWMVLTVAILGTSTQAVLNPGCGQKLQSPVTSQNRPKIPFE